VNASAHNCDNGIVWYEDVGLRFARECDICAPIHRAARLQAICGLTDAERSVRLDDLNTTGSDTQAMIDACRSFAGRPSGILTLWGGTGNGKTLALQAIVNECLERSLSATYTTMYDLAGYVREAYNTSNESAWVRVRLLQNVNVLAIDEFDKLKETDWTRELEMAVIDRRYRYGLSGTIGTMIAMNESPDGLPIWIRSRLLDGRNHVIRNGDPDVRPAMRINI